MVVETRCDPATANFIGPFVDIESGNWLAIAKTFEVDDHIVASCCCTVDIDQCAEAATFGGDCFLQFFFAERWVHQLNTQTVVTSNCDFGTNFTRCFKRENACLFSTSDLDVGSCNEIDFVFANSLGEVFGNGVLNCLAACSVCADACFKNTAWGLARTEARKTNFVGNFAECRIDVAVEFRLINLDGQLDLVAL